jgi:hypothetical protein
MAGLEDISNPKEPMPPASPALRQRAPTMTIDTSAISLFDACCHTHLRTFVFEFPIFDSASEILVYRKQTVAFTRVNTCLNS